MNLISNMCSLQSIDSRVSYVGSKKKAESTLKHILISGFHFVKQRKRKQKNASYDFLNGGMDTFYYETSKE